MTRVSYNYLAVTRVSYNYLAVTRVSYNYLAVTRVSYNYLDVTRVSYNCLDVTKVSYNYLDVTWEPFPFNLLETKQFRTHIHRIGPTPRDRKSYIRDCKRKSSFIEWQVSFATEPFIASSDQEWRIYTLIFPF